MKVIFIEPGNFLRTPQKTNPFLDPIIDVCEKQGIDWEIWMPSRRTPNGYAAKRVHSYGTLRMAYVFCYRILHYVLRFPVLRSSLILGNLFRRVFRSSCDPDVVISLSGFWIHFIKGYFPNSRAVDVQHGIIYSTHPGYFDKTGRIWPLYWRDTFANREFWVYGKGYADCFFRHPDNEKDLAGRVKVIGDVVRAGMRNSDLSSYENRPRRLIVIASQITPDEDKEIACRMKGIYEDFLELVRPLVFGEVPGLAECKVVFRHHPRFANHIDMSDWKVRFPWVDMGDARPWAEVFAETLCVVTINSTVAFDAAAYGVPTIILDGKRANYSNLMKDEYHYPLADLTVERLASMSPDERIAIERKARDWYRTYYTPFDADACLKLLKGETV